MRHKSRNIALLSALAMLVIGVSASAASAAIQFEWKVNGAALASGKTKEFTAKDKGTGLFKLDFGVAGLEIYVTSSKLKVQSGAAIQGGKPGTSGERLELEGVKVTNPANCEIRDSALYGSGEIGKITTLPLKTEIVEGSLGKTGNGKVDLLFTPQGGTVLTVFEITGSSCLLKGNVVQLTGSVLAETTPQKTEAKIGDLLFEAQTKEYRNSNNEFKTAGLKFAGNPATLTGEAETELVSKEVFGAF